MLSGEQAMARVRELIAQGASMENVRSAERILRELDPNDPYLSAHVNDWADTLTTVVRRAQRATSSDVRGRQQVEGLWSFVEAIVERWQNDTYTEAQAALLFYFAGHAFSHLLEDWYAQGRHNAEILEARVALGRMLDINPTRLPTTSSVPPIPENVRRSGNGGGSGIVILLAVLLVLFMYGGGRR